MIRRAMQAYAKNDVDMSVASSNSVQLLLLVYGKLLDHLKVAKIQLGNGEYAIELFSKAHDLIQLGLLSCLDYEEGGEVAKNLGAIYEWALKTILEARINRDPAKVQEVIDVLMPLYEGWLELGKNTGNVVAGGYPQESRSVAV
jgi:flagellar secretion chaperone FliS